MLAWKFLAPGGVAPFTAVRWPAAGGAWVEARSERAGVHACEIADLPYWIDQELWIVELEGDVRRAGRQLVASRGRLVAQVPGWPAAQDAFTAACIERTRERVSTALLAGGRQAEVELLRSRRWADAERETALSIAASGAQFAGYVADVLRRRPYPATCAYMAANAAAALGGSVGHDHERATQASWLAEHLMLAHPR